MIENANARYVDDFKFVIEVKIDWVSSNYPAAAKDYTVSVYHDRRNALSISKYAEDNSGNIVVGATKSINFDGSTPSGFLNTPTTGLGAFSGGKLYTGSRSLVNTASGSSEPFDISKYISQPKAKVLPDCSYLLCAFQNAETIEDFFTIIGKNIWIIFIWFDI